MEIQPLKSEWQDSADKTSNLQSDYISSFDHISEIILTWATPSPANARNAEACITTVEELHEHASSKNSGWSVKIVGTGSSASRQKSNERTGFHTPTGKQ